MARSSSIRGWRPADRSTKNAGVRSDTRDELHPTFLFALLFTALFITHLPLLRLPYFWDEAGYFIPAARDLLMGSLVPHSTASNAHPPLVMAYLAAWWKVSVFTPAVTRTAMLLVSAFALLGVYRLANLVNRPVAVASTVCVALYPVFFAQSSLAHLDVAAAGLTFWGLAAYIGDRRAKIAIWFSLAALAKETAVIAPLALFAWELLCVFRRRSAADPKSDCLFFEMKYGRTIALIVPSLALGCWLGYLYWRTGHVLGDPEYVRYNVQATLHPLRIAIAAVIRVWQVLGYMNLFLLTGAAALAMFYSPLRTESGGNSERERIAIPVQVVFGVVTVAYVVAMAVIGGAELARYMLPVTPLVVIICVSTVWRRVRSWRLIMGLVVLGFVVGLFVNPPYGFAPEDNLAYRDYVLLHKAADEFVQQHYGNARVLTAWPASDELRRPYLGYVSRPVRVVNVDDFSIEHLLQAEANKQAYDVALVFSTKYEPEKTLVGHWPAWDRIKARFFGFHRDVPPEAAAQILGGTLVFEQHRGGQWAAVIDFQRAFSARVFAP